MLPVHDIKLVFFLQHTEKGPPMTDPESIQSAFLTLSDPSSPGWGDAFRFLAAQPETAEMMLETFRETLEAMGVEPAGRDAVSGEPAYSLSDVARAMGISENDLGEAAQAAAAGPGTSSRQT